MIIVYSHVDETIICTPETEPEVIAEYFAAHTGRDIEDYDREVMRTGVAHITNRLQVNMG